MVTVKCLFGSLSKGMFRNNTLSRNIVNGSVLNGRNVTVSGSGTLSRNIYTTSLNYKDDKKIEVTFHLHNGKTIKSSGKEGDTLLDVVVDNDLDLEGFGACEGTLTCSTCHVVLKKEDYDRLGTVPEDEEYDMLELASGLTDTSRLGCQIELRKDLDGLEVKVPESTIDARNK